MYQQYVVTVNHHFFLKASFNSENTRQQVLCRLLNSSNVNNYLGYLKDIHITKYDYLYKSP